MSKKIVIDPMDDISAPKKAKPELKNVTTVEAKPVTSAIQKIDNVVKFEITDDLRSLAKRFGLNLSVSHQERIDRAAQNLNQSVQYMLAAGIDLLALRADCEHGEFVALLDDRGFEQRAAYRAIQYAEFLLSRSEAEREKLLVLPKSHVLAIAGADEEVIHDLLENGDIDLTELSVRQLRVTIKDLSERKTDIAVQLEKSELEVERLQQLVKDLREARVKTGGDVPVPVQDYRLECAALHKKADLSVDDMSDLLGKFLSDSDLGDWNLAVARHLAASLAALHAKTGGLLAQLHRSFGPDSGAPDVADLFGPEETLRCAQEYKVLTDEHKHEETVRAWEREMDRPKGAGRPRAKPSAKA